MAADETKIAFGGALLYLDCNCHIVKSLHFCEELISYAGARLSGVAVSPENKHSLFRSVFENSGWIFYRKEIQRLLLMVLYLYTVAELKKYSSFQSLKASEQKSNINAEAALLRTFELIDFYIHINKDFKKRQNLPVQQELNNSVDWKYL